MVMTLQSMITKNMHKYFSIYSFLPVALFRHVSYVLMILKCVCVCLCVRVYHDWERERFLTVFELHEYESPEILKYLFILIALFFSQSFFIYTF